MNSSSDQHYPMGFWLVCGDVQAMKNIATGLLLFVGLAANPGGA